jgi:hypothetical protein
VYSELDNRPLAMRHRYTASPARGMFTPVHPSPLQSNELEDGAKTDALHPDFFQSPRSCTEDVSPRGSTQVLASQAIGLAPLEAPQAPQVARSAPRHAWRGRCRAAKPNHRNSSSEQD